MVFLKKKKIQTKIFFFYLFSMQLFSVDAMVFSKKNLDFFLTLKKWKPRPQKLLIISRDPFLPQSSPGTDITDKRTNVWCRDFMIWKIIFGMWAVGWTEGKKGPGWLWAAFEARFFTFLGSKKLKKNFENTIASALKSCIEKKVKKYIFFGFFFFSLTFPWRAWWGGWRRLW